MKLPTGILCDLYCFSFVADKTFQSSSIEIGGKCLLAGPAYFSKVAFYLFIFSIIYSN